jgi:hypothetical protein
VLCQPRAGCPIAGDEGTARPCCLENRTVFRAPRAPWPGAIAPVMQSACHTPAGTQSPRPVPVSAQPRPKGRALRTRNRGPSAQGSHHQTMESDTWVGCDEVNAIAGLRRNARGPQAVLCRRRSQTGQK